MKVGDRYSSPWGEYTVYQTEPVVQLRAGNHACIVGPSDELVARLTFMGSGTLPVTLEPANETGTGPTPHGSAAGGDSPAESRAELVRGPLYPSTDALFDAPTLYQHEKTLGAYRSTMSMAWVPSDEMPMVWVPCLTRSEIGEHAQKTHVYFMAELSGSSFCPQCRASKPRYVWLRDGVVVRDSHHDVPSAGPIMGFVPARDPDREFSRSGLFSPDENRPLSSGSDGEFSSSDLSPTTAPNCVGPLARDVVGAGAESSASALLAMTVASEETSLTEVPPSSATPPVSDAKAAEVPPSSAVPSLFPADDPKESVADFSRLYKNPVGRAWLGLWEWKEWCAERAAIIEYDANQPKKVAEARARELAGTAPR